MTERMAASPKPEAMAKDRRAKRTSMRRSRYQLLTPITNREAAT